MLEVSSSFSRQYTCQLRLGRRRLLPVRVAVDAGAVVFEVTRRKRGAGRVVAVPVRNSTGDVLARWKLALDDCMGRCSTSGRQVRHRQLRLGGGRLLPIRVAVDAGAVMLEVAWRKRSAGRVEAVPVRDSTGDVLARWKLALDTIMGRCTTSA
jgi:hypothetical protein